MSFRWSGHSAILCIAKLKSKLSLCSRDQRWTLCFEVYETLLYIFWALLDRANSIWKISVTFSLFCLTPINALPFYPLFALGIKVSKKARPILHQNKRSLPLTYSGLGRLESACTFRHWKNEFVFGSMVESMMWF